MPIQILMPALSPTMTEGTLSRWLKKEGDEVKAGQVIAEIETDKATMEVEAVDEGTLGRILIQSGSTGVKVNSVIALLLEEGESPSTLDTASTVSPVVSTATAPEAPVTTVLAAAQPLQGNLQPPLITSPQTEIQRQKITPVAKRLAKQKGLNIASLRGTGPNGRIIKDDVLNASQAPATSSAKASVSYDQISVEQPYTALPITSVRKVIAQRLTESKQTIPHFYLTVDIEVDHLLALREEFNKAQSEVKVSVNDMIIKALANALVAVPQANAAWAGTEIRQFQRVDISVAVSIEGGLVTPVIRYADGKPLAVIAKEMKSLAERARQGKLKPEDWQGGSATLSNLGMFGVRQFEAIINPPQAAILAVGASEKKPVVRDGNIIVAPVMSCTLSADHRVIDGVLGAQLLAAFKEQLLHPLRLVM